ncbi:MAG: DUF350 domain-containing protein [Candidatus Altarchaeaceae archaeon]
MDLLTSVGSIGLGLIQLVVGLLLAMGSIYVGFRMVDNIVEEINFQDELKKGNIAIAIVAVAVVITLAEVVAGGVNGLTIGLTGQTINIGKALIVGIVQLIVGIIFAVLAIYLALKIWSKLTKEIDEGEELRKGNLAIGIVLGGVLIAVGFVIQASIEGIARAIGAVF